MDYTRLKRSVRMSAMLMTGLLIIAITAFGSLIALADEGVACGRVFVSVQNTTNEDLIAAGHILLNDVLVAQHPGGTVPPGEWAYIGWTPEWGRHVGKVTGFVVLQDADFVIIAHEELEGELSCVDASTPTRAIPPEEPTPAPAFQFDVYGNPVTR